jgi:hypothetical protein
LNIARVLVQAVFGALISYYIGSLFCTSLITGTTTSDTLVTTLIPITLAAVAVIVVISVGFSRNTIGE